VIQLAEDDKYERKPGESVRDHLKRLGIRDMTNDPSSPRAFEVIGIPIKRTSDAMPAMPKQNTDDTEKPKQNTYESLMNTGMKDLTNDPSSPRAFGLMMPARPAKKENDAKEEGKDEQAAASKRRVQARPEAGETED